MFNIFPKKKKGSTVQTSPKSEGEVVREPSPRGENGAKPVLPMLDLRSSNSKSPKKETNRGGLTALLSPKSREVEIVSLFGYIQSGAIDVIKKALQNGSATVEERHPTSGQTPLLTASAEGNIDIARLLLKHKADIKARDTMGFNALHVALLNNHLDISMFLISKGADVNSLTQKKMSPLHYAVRIKYAEDYTPFLSVLDELITHGAEVNAKNENNETPLYHAVCHGGELAVVFLLLNGADPNTPSKDGMTPLHVACTKGNLVCVQALLNFGANVSMNTAQGTAMQEAEKANNRDVIALMFARSGINTGETMETHHIASSKLDEVTAQVEQYQKIVGDFMSNNPIEKETSKNWHWKIWKKKADPAALPEPSLSAGNHGHRPRPKSEITPVIHVETAEESHPIKDAFSTTDPSEQFEIGQLLGEGAYGQVFCAKHIGTGFVVAIKSMLMNPKQKKSIEKEVKILSKCHHPNIVQYYGSYFKQGNINVIMEYCTGGSTVELLEVLGRPFTEYELSSFYHEVLKGLEYLHKSHFIHRDLKPQNILVSGSGIPKIADFGVSRELDQGQVGQTIVGTPLFSSPEVLEGEPYDYSADIWSLGVTIICTIEGHPPHHDKALLSAIMTIASGPPPELTCPEKASEGLKNFLFCCLQKDATRRKKASELLQHDFIQNLPLPHDKILKSLMVEYKEKAKKMPPKQPAKPPRSPFEDE